MESIKVITRLVTELIDIADDLSEEYENRFSFHPAVEEALDRIRTLVQELIDYRDESKV